MNLHNKKISVLALGGTFGLFVQLLNQSSFGIPTNILGLPSAMGILFFQYLQSFHYCPLIGESECGFPELDLGPLSNGESFAAISTSVIAYALIFLVVFQQSGI